VALFLAVLELTKHGRICISEDSTYLYRKQTASSQMMPDLEKEDETWTMPTADPSEKQEF
jgi:hypothetical protein